MEEGTSHEIRWLVLVPTQLERDQLELDTADDVRVELCGFGLVVAGAKASQLITSYRPQRVLLCGIAGALSDDIDVGDACQFKRVGIHGIGVGHAGEHTAAEKLGWLQWKGGGIEIGSELVLDFSGDDETTRDLLVSVCAGSSNSFDAELVRSAFPAAFAEEMEGFAVATAAKLASVPCQIVRGFSNIAGDRDQNNWEIAEAMSSVSKLANQIIGRDQ